MTPDERRTALAQAATLAQDLAALRSELADRPTAFAVMAEGPSDALHEIESALDRDQAARLDARIAALLQGSDAMVRDGALPLCPKSCDRLRMSVSAYPRAWRLLDKGYGVHAYHDPGTGWAAIEAVRDRWDVDFMFAPDGIHADALHLDLRTGRCATLTPDRVEEWLRQLFEESGSCPTRRSPN